jgi:hypothetical protein
VADIKQAVKWMEEGKSVRITELSRTTNPPPPGYVRAQALRLDDAGFIVCTCHSQRLPFSPSSILADWEIAL